MLWLSWGCDDIEKLEDNLKQFCLFPSLTKPVCVKVSPSVPLYCNISVLLYDLPTKESYIQLGDKMKEIFSVEGAHKRKVSHLNNLTKPSTPLHFNSKWSH